MFLQFCQYSSSTRLTLTGRIQRIPYRAYILRVFNFANFANLESFAKLFQHKFDTSKLSHIGDVKDGSISVLQVGGWKVSRDQATSSTRSVNTEIAAVLHPSTASAKAVRGTYLKISTEKKAEAEIRQRAAEHGVLATVWYYAMKLPVPLKESLVRTWKNAYTAKLCRLR